MKTSQNKKILSGSCEIDSLGIVVDLNNEEGRNLTKETMHQTGDPEFKNLVSMAHGLGKKYIIAAGKFNGSGIFGVFCDDTDNLIAAFKMANTKMHKLGFRATTWMIKPDECANLLENVSLQCLQKGGR